ncbi:hypothetical protein pb186bvf_014180 [Paramecium bursaria]
MKYSFEAYLYEYFKLVVIYKNLLLYISITAQKAQQLNRFQKQNKTNLSQFYKQQKMPAQIQILDYSDTTIISSIILVNYEGHDPHI